MAGLPLGPQAWQEGPMGEGERGSPASPLRACSCHPLLPWRPGCLREVLPPPQSPSLSTAPENPRALSHSPLCLSLSHTHTQFSYTHNIFNSLSIVFPLMLTTSSHIQPSLHFPSLSYIPFLSPHPLPLSLFSSPHTSPGA